VAEAVASCRSDGAGMIEDRIQTERKEREVETEIVYAMANFIDEEKEM
jgi:hypothetical protein